MCSPWFMDMVSSSSRVVLRAAVQFLKLQCDHSLEWDIWEATLWNTKPKRRIITVLQFPISFAFCQGCLYRTRFMGHILHLFFFFKSTFRSLFPDQKIGQGHKGGTTVAQHDPSTWRSSLVSSPLTEPDLVVVGLYRCNRGQLGGWSRPVTRSFSQIPTVGC